MEWAVILLVRNAITVVVCVYAIGLAVSIRVQIAFVGVAVAVIVQTVALLQPLSIIRVTDDQLAQRTVVDEMQAEPLAALGSAQILVNSFVAVVILAVARFHRTRVDLGIEGGAISIVRDLVVVVIRVARVSHRIVVKIRLTRVGNRGAVVLGIRHTVPVVVVGETVGNPVQVGVLEPFVDFTVAIVIQPIA